MFEQDAHRWLVCPWCLGELERQGDDLRCAACRARYRVERGIPNLLVSEARLFCPRCARDLEKTGASAICRRCGRRFDMGRRVERDLSSRGQPC